MCTIHSLLLYQYDPGREYADTGDTATSPSGEPDTCIVVEPIVTVPHPVPAPPALEEVLING